MTDERRIELRTAIVEALSQAQNETSLSDLLHRLHESGVVDETSVKAVIWQLIHEGEVELSSRRALRVSDKYRREFALAR
jgi:hypothetical protein